MSTSNRKAVLALILTLLCAVAWKVRFMYLDSLEEAPIPREAVKAAPPTIAPTPRPMGEVAEVIATIDWADPEDPVAVPLDSRGDRFVFETRDGLQVWQSKTRQLSRLQSFPAKGRLRESVWVSLQKKWTFGTLLAAIPENEQATTLYWVKNDQDGAENRMTLPDDMKPSAIVPVSPGMALICDASAKRALVVGFIDGDLKQITLSSPSLGNDVKSGLKNMLTARNIVGPVDGVGEVQENESRREDEPKPPLVFDTHTCEWKARYLPEPMASGLDLRIETKSLMSWSGPVITAASWIDPVTRSERTLGAPLVWEEQDHQWLARQAASLPGVAPDRQFGAREGQWSYAADLAQGKLASLGPQDERWRDATQRFPSAQSLKLLPIWGGGVLALLIDPAQPGRIVQLDPEPEKSLNARLSQRISGTDTFIPLADEGAMIIAGSRSEYSILIRNEEPRRVILPDLPQPMRRPAGVELFDGTVVVFGGLHPDCSSGYERGCHQGPQPSFRLIPKEQRWQPLPTLSVPFAEEHDNAVLVNGKELFYLSSNHTPWDEDQGARSTRLHRWQLEGVTQDLAATRFSRYNASLLVLDDGRLAVAGGAAADEPDCPACRTCQEQRQAEIARLRSKQAPRAQEEEEDGEGEDDPETMVPQCEVCMVPAVGERFRFSRVSEIYDPRTDKWTQGPFSNYPGGRAFKMENGRIFKFGLVGYNPTDADYAAETADPSLAQWSLAPPFPFKKPAVVGSINAIGNQVLIVMEKPADRYVIWDDATRNWQVHPLPQNSDWGLRNAPLHIGPNVAGKMLMIYEYSFEFLSWPFQ